MPRMIRLRFLLILSGAILAGCSSTLETGYQPRPLGGSSPEVRRGYYAQPFTPEAQKARDYQEQFGGADNSTRPRQGY